MTWRVTWSVQTERSSVADLIGAARRHSVERNRAIVSLFTETRTLVECQW
jgi:hypothetical protein